MNPFSRSNFRRPGFLSVVISLSLAVLSTSAFAWQGTTTQVATGTAAAPARKAATTLSSAERKATARVKLRPSVTSPRLSAPDFEGRGTGQPGADKAAQYLADTFAKLGLKPGGDNGTYLQPIKFRSAQVLSTSSVKVGDAVLQHATDYVILPPYTSDQVDVTGDVVFAGFGVVSPELNRDDFASLI